MNKTGSPKLIKRERREIRAKTNEVKGAGWLDSGEPLTSAEKAILESRLAAYAKNPYAGSSWEETKARVLERLKK